MATYVGFFFSFFRMYFLSMNVVTSTCNILPETNREEGGASNDRPCLVFDHNLVGGFVILYID